jgi:hypothetical protein
MYINSVFLDAAYTTHNVQCGTGKGDIVVEGCLILKYSPQLYRPVRHR